MNWGTVIKVVEIGLELLLKKGINDRIDSKNGSQQCKSIAKEKVNKMSLEEIFNKVEDKK